MKKIVSFTMFLLLSTLCFAELLAFMVYGKDFIVTVSLPDTWAVDMEFAKAQGLNAFFYIKPEINPQKSYIILELFRVQPKDNFDEFIKSDKQEISSSMPMPGFKFTELKAIKNENKFSTKTFRLEKNQSSPVQYIAYINTNAAYYIKIYITLSRNPSDNEHLKDFMKAVEKISYQAADVQVK